MPTQGSWRPLVISSISSPFRLMVRRGVRIELVGDREAHDDVLPGRDAAQNPARVVRQELGAVIGHADFVGVFGAGQGRRRPCPRRSRRP